MAEIKISDLSVGDWIAYNGKKYRIKEISSPYASVTLWGNNEQRDESIVLIEPIPLTPEILEKNGFERGEYSEIRVYNEWEIGEWTDPPYVSVRLDIDRQVIRVTNRGRDMFIADKEVYVHQLQHALRLAGVEKEIEV